MFNFISKWFQTGTDSTKSIEDKKKFQEAVYLMLDGEASLEQQKFVMEKIKCCQYSNSKYELEKCLRDKLKALYCSKEAPNNMEQAILQKITAGQVNL